ncbi:glucosaminidase domain-containing protein [Curvivirga aplysinae]|uniref:glucosaminidase domain-containing protein n=1 Tax=Curvivirga aplysinae TaxID=2529852 RepID=UPI0012BB9445|nr:glucosaminidase domain-containing protein [Curvivirga aplysinae]MTI08607.1 hypothetical protein [Curvivirga aplysinae]
MSMNLNTTGRKSGELTPADLFQAVKRSWIFTVIVGFGVGLAVVGLLQPDAPLPAVTSTIEVKEAAQKPQKLATHTVEKLQKKFQQIGYSIDKLEVNGYTVPRIWPDAVPDDMDSIQVVQDRKALFMKMMLPLVLLSNERIERDRVRLLSIAEKQAKGEVIAKADQNWLENTAKSYRLDEVDMAELIKRVDVVPVSLAVAQAAIESGWGTSRFARQGNALFGQWTWGDEGIVPDGREEGKTHKIKSFESPLDSVVAYVHNLNTNRAYRELRNLRADLRKQGIDATGLDLTMGLQRYSEKGMEYVYLLQNIINSNQMARFDDAQLGGTKLASLN